MVVKRLVFPCALIFLFIAASNSHAGFDLLKKVKENVEQKLDQKVDDSDDSIDKGVDGTEKAVKGEGEEDSGKASSEKAGSSGSGSSAGTRRANLQVWSKYDFVPGDEIIFYDDLLGGKNSTKGS
jgi:hypothetical protein